MTPSHTRSLTGLLLAGAIAVGVWAYDLHMANAAIRTSIQQAQSQLRRARALPAGAPVIQSARVSSPELAYAADADVRRARHAAAGFGSDALNLAAALQRMKEWCTAAGLQECSVRRASLTSASVASPTAGSAPTAAPAGLKPYPVALGATFDARGVQKLLELVSDGDFLYRVERINIVQNRAELDVVFFHDSGMREVSRRAFLPASSTVSPR